PSTASLLARLKPPLELGMADTKFTVGGLDTDGSATFSAPVVEGGSEDAKFGTEFGDSEAGTGSGRGTGLGRAPVVAGANGLAGGAEGGLPAPFSACPAAFARLLHGDAGSRCCHAGYLLVVSRAERRMLRRCRPVRVR